MSTIIFEGNTYTFGATVSANSGTGTTSYVFSGLTSDSTYGFILWAFNGFGPSSIIGPVVRNTLSIAPIEERNEFNAFTWNWGGALEAYLGNFLYTASGVSGSDNSGNPINLYVSSEDLGNTNWLPGNASTGVYSKPSWVNILSGITDPFGGTGAYQYVINPPSTQNYTIRQGLGQVEAGVTYIMSFYINVDGTTTGWGVYNTWTAGFGGFRGISMQQILPIGATSASPSISPNVLFPSGTGGWHRFAWRFYATPVLDTVVVGTGTFVTGITWEDLTSAIMNRTFASGVTANIYLYGPQLEIET